MWLQVRSGPDAGSAVELPEDGPFVLGRQRGCDLIVRDARASRRHVELQSLPNFKWRLTDLGSANGTYVDGGLVTEVVLEGGEEIKIGDVLIAVTTAPPPGRDHDPVPPAGTQRTPAGETDHAPALATQSMVRRMVDAGTRRASRTALLAGGGALVAVFVVVALLVAGVFGGNDDNAVPQVVSEVSPSTALIVTSLDGTRTGTGSGWVLDGGAGLIVTNAHVVNQGTAFRVTVGGRTSDASVVGVSPCEDLALLSVGSGGLKTAALGSGSSVRQGESVVALGFPGDAQAGDRPGSTRGVVSNDSTSFDDPAPDVPAYPEVLQTDTPLNPGNSGGPLADLDARVIGVNSAARSTGSDGRPLQNVNFAIPIDRARRVLADIQAGRSAAWTGLTFAYPTDAELDRRGLPPGLVIAGIVPGTPAASAASEIEPGDFLAGVDGTPISNTLLSLCDVLGDRRAGDEVILNLAEPGQAETRRVTVRLAG